MARTIILETTTAQKHRLFPRRITIVIAICTGFVLSRALWAAIRQSDVAELLQKPVAPAQMLSPNDFATTLQQRASKEFKKAERPVPPGAIVGSAESFATAEQLRRFYVLETQRMLLEGLHVKWPADAHGDTATSNAASYLALATAAAAERFTSLKYEAIQLGMTYKEVSRIMGTSGNQLTTTSTPGFTTAVYVWRMVNDVPWNTFSITVIFENNKVYQKRLDR